MTSPVGTRSGQEWVLAPLLGSGLPVEELRTMLFEVAFAGIRGAGELDASLRTVVAGRTDAVRAAWIETIDRMIGSVGS